MRDGGAEGTRTPDPHTASVVLSQLSYSPACILVRYPLDGPGIGGQPGRAYAGRVRCASPFTAAIRMGEFGPIMRHSHHLALAWALAYYSHSATEVARCHASRERQPRQSRYRDVSVQG
jgi:hypothetical protein